MSRKLNNRFVMMGLAFALVLCIMLGATMVSLHEPSRATSGNDLPFNAEFVDIAGATSGMRFARTADGLWYSLNSMTPVSDSENFNRIVVAGSSAFAHSSEGIWYAWGDNSGGQLGLGDRINRTNPTPIPNSNRFTDLSVIARRTSWITYAHELRATTYDGSIYHWGEYAGSGNLNEGVPVHLISNSPMPMPQDGNSNSNFSRAGNGIWYAWGINTAGMLGLGHANFVSEHDSTPIPNSENFDELNVHGNSVFARNTVTGTWYAWGNSQWIGFLGVGDTANRNIPTPIPNSENFDELDIQSNRVFARNTVTGAWYAWGSNGQGALGVGNTASRNVPTLIPNSENFDELNIQGNRVFARNTETGILYTWGDTGFGLLSDFYNYPTHYVVPTSTVNLTTITKSTEHTTNTSWTSTSHFLFLTSQGKLYSVVRFSTEDGDNTITATFIAAPHRQITTIIDGVETTTTQIGNIPFERPANPTIVPVGHNAFMDWFAHPTEGTTPINFSQPITQNTRIYPRFVPNQYDVLFYTHDIPYTTTTRLHTFEDRDFGSSVPTVSNPTAPTGHHFMHWSTTPFNPSNPTAIRAPFTFTGKTVPLDGLTLYAVFAVNEYSLLFYSDGVLVDSANVDFGDAITRPANPSNPVGYTFAHWSIYDSTYTHELRTEFDFTGATMPVGGLVLYAVFNPIMIRVTFNAGEGEMYVGDSEYIYVHHTHGRIVRPADPTRNGYNFIGWSLESTGEQPQFNFGTTSVTSAITLHAVWEEVQIEDDSSFPWLILGIIAFVVAGLLGALIIIFVIVKKRKKIV